MIVTRDLLDLEKRAGIVAAVSLLHVLLKAEERGTLRKEHGEGREGDIRHRIGAVPAGARVWQSRHDSPPSSDDVIEAARAHAPKGMPVLASTYKLRLCYDVSQSRELSFCPAERVPHMLARFISGNRAEPQ